MMPDLAELLRLYGGDTLNPQSLDWSEFQNAVFVRMFRKCQIKGELRNDEQGEVDFVLVESRDNPVTNKVVGEVQHLFECKNYNRALELAVAAKFLLVGLYRPNIASLNLVSRTELQPQALEYATSFYQLDNEEPTHRKLGGMTIFRHFITRDLVGFDPVDLRGVSSATASRKSSRELTWELIELRPYSERVVPGTTQGRDEAVLSPKYYYRLEATLSVSRRIKDGELNLVEPSGAIRLIEERTTADPSSRVFRHSALFQITEPPSPEIRLQLALWRPGKPLSKYPVASIRVSNEGSAPADFRPADAVRFEREFAETNSWRIALLTGEAGAGKTRLCNRFAQDQRARARWDVLRFDISENEDADLIREIAVALMLPSRLRVEDLSSVRAAAAQVVDTLVGYRIPGGERSQGRDSMDPAQFTAQLAVGLGPRLIIIRNCERLSEATAGKVEQLMHAIERRGWGDVHVILEGREPGGGTEWASLRRRLHDTLDGVVAFSLDQMTRDAVYDLLDRLFERISPELQEICWKRAGGNPLFLQNLLKWLQSSGGIESADGRLRVTSPSLFYQEFGVSTTTRRDSRLAGGRGDAIILARLSALALQRLDAPPPFDDPHLVLGLLALAETPARVDVLIGMTGLADAIQPLIESLRANDLLDDSAKPDELRFRHDLLREAAIVYARDATNAAAIYALSKHLPHGFTVEDLVSLELLADLRRFVGQPDAAWSHYQRATEFALNNEAFLDVCRIADKQERVYGAERPTGSRSFRDYLEMLMARAWAEWNCGSLRTARGSYHRVIGLARKAPDSDINSTAVRSIVGHARSRLVGIMLALSDPDDFVASTISALQEYSDIGDYNSVMNRIVLFCASYGLPELGRSFLDLATAHVAHRGAEEGREPEGEAVICSDAAVLYQATMPEAALPILYEEVRRSRKPRQRLHAKIDVLAAEYLAFGKFDLTHSDALRTEAAGLGLYGFVARLDLLEAAVELDEKHYDAGRAKLEKAEARIAIQTQSTNDIGLLNNKLLLALATGSRDEARCLIRQLIKSVESALDGRERSVTALRARVMELAGERERKLAGRFAPSPLLLPVPEQSPAFCGDVMLVWLNLRRLAASCDTTIAVLAEPVANRVPSEIDIALAEAAFTRTSSRCGMDHYGTRLALCV